MLMQKACFAEICQNNTLIIGLKPGRFQAFKGFLHGHHPWPTQENWKLALEQTYL
jgi:hypothetical protein